MFPLAGVPGKLYQSGSESVTISEIVFVFVFKSESISCSVNLASLAAGQRIPNPLDRDQTPFNLSTGQGMPNPLDR